MENYAKIIGFLSKGTGESFIVIDGWLLNGLVRG